MYVNNIEIWNLNINLTSKHWGNISKGKLSTARYKKLYLNAIVGCLGLRENIIPWGYRYGLVNRSAMYVYKLYVRLGGTG